MPRSARPKPRVQGATEKQVTAQVLDAAALFGLKLERRNVGLAFDARGKGVQFGTPGEPDWAFCPATGPNRGRRGHVEIKRGDFDPRKLRGEKAAHFARQRAAMEAINAAGGFSFWVRDGADAADVFRRLATLPGLRVEFDADGFCVTTDEPEGGTP